jgi:hypothetical protein
VRALDQAVGSGSRPRGDHAQVAGDGASELVERVTGRTGQSAAVNR